MQPHEPCEHPAPVCTMDVFVPDPAEVRRARQVVENALREHGCEPELIEQAALAVSEMVTNAVMHARTPFEVRCLLNGVARIEVTDHDPDVLPEVARQDPASVGGYGLRIVAELASAWGVQVGPDRKTLWCELGPACQRHGRVPNRSA
jgi:anti-sigma regulatory factor (Ser/Thr protein kinase)